MMQEPTLGFAEKVIFALRALYDRYGYTQYRMSKFEEYDLYVRNKSFLVSDNIITFTDRAGKLLALKPDVTLSIVKSSKDVACGSGEVLKVYYNEHVYRVPKGADTFKEIMQVGLECVGDTDLCCVSEVMMLAAMSLAEISEAYVLDVSHLGLVSAFLDKLGAEGDTRSTLLGCIGEKNVHGVAAICAGAGLDPVVTETLCRLVGIYGDAENVLSDLTTLVKDAGGCGAEALSELQSVVAAVRVAVPDAHMQIDFSVINNMSYYNGLVFRGFIRGIPASILSGGQYDLLVRRMGKGAGAVGFAVYLDLLDELGNTRPTYDVDAVLLYDGNTSPATLSAAVCELTNLGERVMTVRRRPAGITYRRLLRLGEKGVEVIENH